MSAPRSARRPVDQEESREDGSVAAKRVSSLVRAVESAPFMARAKRVTSGSSRSRKNGSPKGRSLRQSRSVMTRHATSS